MDYFQFKKEFIDPRKLKPVGITFVDKTLRSMMNLWDNAIFSNRSRLFNDNFIKYRFLFSLLMLILTTFIHTISSLLPMAIMVMLLIAYSLFKKEFTLADFFHGGFLFSLIFSLLLGSPAMINFFSHSHGELILIFWKNHDQSAIGITREGLFSFGLLTLRVLISVSLVLWSILPIPFSQLMKILEELKFPTLFVRIVTLTLIFLHILIKKTEEVHLAKKSRMICKETNFAGQKWVGLRIARAWEESFMLMEEIHQAMIARGLREYK